MVTYARNIQDANPDVLDYSQVTGCRINVDESRIEIEREGPDGKKVSYNPPRYEYSYDFDVIISVNHPYFSEMKFRLNDSSIELHSQAGRASPPRRWIPAPTWSTSHTKSSARR